MGTLFRYADEDGAKVRRLIAVPGVGLCGIARVDVNAGANGARVEWRAYAPTSYADRYGLVCFIGDTEEQVIKAARAVPFDAPEVIR